MIVAKFRSVRSVCEEAVRDADRAFVRKALAMYVLRESGEWSYGGLYSSFSEYCLRELEIGDSHASRCVTAGRVLFSLAGSDPVKMLRSGSRLKGLPSNLAQCRELFRLNARQAKRVWRIVGERRVLPTAADIRSVADELYPREVVPRSAGCRVVAKVNLSGEVVDVSCRSRAAVLRSLAGMDAIEGVKSITIRFKEG